MPLSVGLDEAGRGAVLGPLVIGCVAANDADRRWFAKQNVRDSKIVPPDERTFLAERIRERCWFSLRVCLPIEIDAAVRDRAFTLNGLECSGMAELLKKFREQHPKVEARMTVDACSINAEGFRKQLLTACDWSHDTPLRSWHGADKRDRTVAAASILAKFERERLLDEIKARLETDFGCGYPHDEKTREFVRRADMNSAHVRWSWKTASSLSSAKRVLS